MRNGGIVCSNVVKRYGGLTALSGINLNINPEDFLILLGPNGAGKTTLMKILCGLVRPTSGTAGVSGMDVCDQKVRCRVGVISHQSFLYDNLTARENLIFYSELYGVKNPANRADDLLESVGLYPRRDDLAGNFSRGMTQRLSIARALVADPDFVFLDEPFTGLDLNSASLFMELLRNLHKRGKTVMMITHDIDAGISLSTRAVILNAGRKTHDAPTEGVSGEELKKIYMDKTGT
ncbi:MAG: ABC transporter ATP-binding protein [bacterium]|nr:MAG: ABC transporter ATP-binding protein [bacterium]